jgi:hypothetical protein
MPQEGFTDMSQLYFSRNYFLATHYRRSVLVIIEMKFTALVDPFLGFPIAEISELKVSLI